MKVTVAAGLAVVALAAVGTSAGQAQDKWPSREITLINSFPPGASTDLTARAVAQGAEKKLGATIIVKNVVGGAGTLGPAQLASAKPDGYTIGLVGSSSIATAPHTMDVPYKAFESFDFIAQVAELRYGIGVGSKSSIQSIDDLIAEGKKRRVTYASTSPINVVAMFQLAKATGANFRWVVFGGGNESVLQAVGGHVDAVIQTVTEMKPQMEAGTLRGLAAAGPVRWPEAPEMKTLREMGYEAISTAVFGYAFPAGVDPAIRARMEKAMLDALAEKDVQEQITKLGVVPSPATGQQFRDTLKKTETDSLPILQDAGMVKKKS